MSTDFMLTDDDLAEQESFALAEIELCKKHGNRKALLAAYDEGLRVRAEGGLILAGARDALCTALGRPVERFEAEADALRSEVESSLSADEEQELLELREASRNEAIEEVVDIIQQVAYEGADFDEEYVKPLLLRAGMEVREFGDGIKELREARESCEQSRAEFYAMVEAAMNDPDYLRMVERNAEMDEMRASARSGYRDIFAVPPYATNAMASNDLAYIELVSQLSQAQVVDTVQAARTLQRLGISRARMQQDVRRTRTKSPGLIHG